jgi:hypothetical protein
MNSKELDEYIESAKALTRERIAKAQKKFGLGSFAQFNLDLEQGAIFFKEADGTVKVIASVVPIGSWAKTPQSWLWSLENESIPAGISAPLEPVKLFGAKHDAPALQHAFSPCDEALAWALSSVSLKILDAQCVYRVDQGKNLLFLLLNNIERVH